MTIISEARNFYIKTQDGELHSTRYKTKEAASEAARKIAAGLLHFQPLAQRLNQQTNFSNHA